MSASERLSEAIESHVVIEFNLFGVTIPITDTVIVMWIVMSFLIIAAFVLTRRMKTIPKGKQNLVEIVVEFINNFTKGSLGHHWRPFAPYLGTVILFLIFSNTISIFSIIPETEILQDFVIRPPTKDINVTVCLALISIMVVIFSGIRYKKPSGWLKSFVEPLPVVLPMKIIEYFIRPLSLSMRLFGNILGAFIVMELLYMALPTFFPAVFSIYFDLFDGILQAYVFVFLTSIYIAEAIE